MTDAMKRRLFGGAALAVAGAALFYVGMSDMGDDLVYYWTPTELISAAHAEEA
ncbi:MAG: cytochrome c-type biogenesis protein CcmE, partial [Myxococcota bacterium]